MEVLRDRWRCRSDDLVSEAEQPRNPKLQEGSEYRAILRPYRTAKSPKLSEGRRGEEEDLTVIGGGSSEAKRGVAYSCSKRTSLSLPPTSDPTVLPHRSLCPFSIFDDFITSQTTDKWFCLIDHLDLH